jgi:hypothetical protein
MRDVCANELLASLIQNCKLVLSSSGGKKHLIQNNANKRFIQLIDKSNQQSNYGRLKYQHHWFTFTVAQLAFMKLMLHSYYTVVFFLNFINPQLFVDMSNSKLSLFCP